MPVIVAGAFIALGLIIAMSQGLLVGSIAGGLISAMGAIPACFGMWRGIQQDTQSTLALSVTAVLVSLGIGGILIILRIVHWVL